MRTSEHYTADLLAYFEGHDREHALYLALVFALEQTLPENFSVRVQKSQISFYGRHLFGAASIPGTPEKGLASGLPDGDLRAGTPGGLSPDRCGD